MVLIWKFTFDIMEVNCDKLDPLFESTKMSTDHAMQPQKLSKFWSKKVYPKDKYA